MKKLYTALILFLYSNFVFGQIVFQKTYSTSSNVNVFAAQVINDGGYIIAGTTWSNNGDIFLLKTDSSGNFQWMKQFGGSLWDDGSSVQQTDDGGYIVSGFTTIPNVQYGVKVYLIKTDSNGDTLWTKMYGDPSTNYSFRSFVRQTSDHGYIISASEDNGVYGGTYLIRTDSIGNLLWINTYSVLTTSINPVLPTSDGGFITLIPDWESRLVKTDANGTALWTKRINSSPYSQYYLTAMEETTDGGYILAGRYLYSGIGNFGAFYLVKTDSSGDTLWTKAYRYNNLSEAHSVQQISDGGYIMAGYSRDTINANHYHVSVLRTDSTGSVIWMRKYGGTGYESAIYVQQAADGGFIAIGGTTSFGSGSSDIYLIKSDSAGVSGCNDSLLNPITIVPTLSFITPNIFYNASIVTGSPPTAVNSIVPQQTILCSSFVSIGENSFTDVMINRVFPNPFTDEISIAIQEQNIAHATFTIKNILGQTVFEKTKHQISNSNYQTNLDLGFLPNGIYLLEVFIDGERMVKKIVKE